MASTGRETGLVTIENKYLFLGFVHLERAVRNADFDAVQRRVKIIDERVHSLKTAPDCVSSHVPLLFGRNSEKDTCGNYNE